MKKSRRAIDKVRASRDGHEFHEAWAARKALQLVLPNAELVGIAVEGLAPSDQETASAETVEVADLVLYYGKHSTFDAARTVVIAQFKYSISSAAVPFRASDAQKTIRKFAAAYRSHKREHGVRAVERKLEFELITNRPIHAEFNKALGDLASEIPLKGDARKQANQFKSACGFKGKELAQFARKVRLIGEAGSLRENKQYLSRVLADWSAAPDAMARARLGGMRQLVREKAGSVSEGQNVIRRTDVLDALELQSPDDLLPCPASFPEVGKVVEREQLSSIIRLVPKLDKPLLIHAAGGVGKTVFLQSLSKALSDAHETVLFDCFGGGAYRAPEDARHLPKRGLIHIINSLACTGLCDPLLPTNENIEELIKSFRARLIQAVATLQRGARDKQLLVFVDAIDNAAEHARDRGERAFPTLLLESFHHSGPVAGVQLIVSCRTERREISRGEANCEEVKLQPFSLEETRKYLRARIKGVSETQVNVGYARSGGNPRILEHLALSDRGLLEPSASKNVIQLDDLLKARINSALGEARRRGYKESSINSFLAGLSVLPPPVPLAEYADAHGMDISAVASFAADLAPLLEQTKHGLMFRDEPTETLVRNSYAAKVDTLRSLAKNLFEKQGVSVYAASALPGLLQKLDDGQQLFDLAFNDRFPSAITSTVGKQNIRYARLKSAVLHAARTENFDRLVHLLVELSTLAAVDQRGKEYVLGNPDLVIASQDVDATRRLFETRTRWPGTRHARLAIASVLAADLSDAARHAVAADDWIHHSFYQDEEYRRDKGGPERLDFASIPLCRVAQNRASDAARFMRGVKDWYAFEVSERLFTLLDQAQKMESIPATNIGQFLNELKSQPGMLAGALSFLELDGAACRPLIVELASSCKKKKTIETSKDVYREKDYLLQDGLLKAAAIAISMGLQQEALAIASAIPHERPRLWSFSDRFADKHLFPFIIHAALLSVAQNHPIVEQTLVPNELIDICSRIQSGLTGVEFRKALKTELEERSKPQQGSPDEKRSVSYETKRDAEHFIDERLEPLLEMTQAFAAMLSSGLGKGDKAFLNLLDAWSRLRKKRERYTDAHETNLFLDLLGRQLLIFSLWARNDLEVTCVKNFLLKMTEDGGAAASTLVELTAILSKRPSLQECAGETAVRAKALIEHENEVSHRASLFAQLARAILPASSKEASLYFRVGLEQMDAIGSGDYQFTNELLLFAAELKGDELAEADFHTLANICELNMPYEEEKFPWAAFARGLARTSGRKMLARLGRWNDRTKISLDYTLLPYLAALIEYDEIDADLALALLRLSDPAELYAFGTQQLIGVIERKQHPNTKEIIAELISQFEQNNPGVSAPDTVATLSEVAQRILGKESEQSAYLSMAALQFRKVRDEENENRNYRGTTDVRFSRKVNNTAQENRRALKNLADETVPSDEASISRAIDALNGMQHIFELKNDFFENLRGKLKFSERSTYIQTIAKLETLDIYTKLNELKECKKKWSNSSAALEKVFHDIGVPLIQIHADEFIAYDRLSGSLLKSASELSGITMPVLALEMVVVFAAPDSHLPASIWMGLAAIICERAKEGEGQTALRRLLNSNSAKLASTVVDGVWKDGLYPKGRQTDIAAGLVWLMLGSPSAAYRWRAAHSVRCLARFSKWEVIDELIQKFHSVEAHPYQAPELPFYFLHARLWLLIAIARIAMDHPHNVAKYADMLKAIALDNKMPHVLLRHFATQALLSCANSGSIALSTADARALNAVNKSPFPPTKTRQYSRGSFYETRPDSMPEPESEFFLDYDFDKTDVQSVSNTFDRSRWEVKDAITSWVRKYDQQITSMNENRGRTTRRRDEMRGMSSRHHLYGQQLGWHALHFVAGEFLAKYPVVKRSYDTEDSWGDWLSRELLTRKDGLWLADGIDRPPLDTQVNLHEKGKKGLVLTGDKKKLLGLLGVSSSIAHYLVVGGDWHSPYNIKVHIDSALAPPQQAKNLALQLSKEDPFQASLPRAEEYDSEEGPYKPWIVWPLTEARLDETDPLGANSVVQRLHFTKSVNAVNSLKAVDPFKRTWTDSEGRLAARSEAWGRNQIHDEEDSVSGERLVCSAEFLKNVLMEQRSELLILVILRRYDKGIGSQNSQYWHTTAVIRVKQSLDLEFYPGLVNALHVMKY